MTYLWPWPWPDAVICEPDLDIPKTCMHTKNERFRSNHSKFGARTGQTNTLFCSCDLDLDFLHQLLDLEILKKYLRMKNGLFRSRFLKVRALQTHRQMRLKQLTFWRETKSHLLLQPFDLTEIWRCPCWLTVIKLSARDVQHYLC